MSKWKWLLYWVDYILPGTVGVQGDPCSSKPGHVLAKGLRFHCLQEEPEEEEDEAWYGMAWPGMFCISYHVQVFGKLIYNVAIQFHENGGGASDLLEKCPGPILPIFSQGLGYFPREPGQEMYVTSVRSEDINGGTCAPGLWMVSGGCKDNEFVSF